MPLSSSDHFSPSVPLSKHATINTMASIFLFLVCFFSSATPQGYDVHNIENQNVVLDDEEAETSEKYHHEGLAEEQRKKECAKAGKGENCDDEKDLQGFGFIPPEIVDMASKVYGMVIGAGALGDKFALREETPDTENIPDATKTEVTNEAPQEVSDNCRYIAAITEGVAEITQLTKQEEILKRKSDESLQAQALYKSAEKHDAQSGVATMKTIGWGATAGCYAFIAATQPINILDANFLLKLGGTALLAGLFLDQSIREKKYAEEIRKIAEGLPKAGVCNPITQVYCYCAQESTRNDAKYCTPKTHNRKIAEGSTRVVCTDENMQADPQCKCAASDTCYDKKLIGKLHHLNKANPAFSNNLKDFQSLMKGELKGGKQTNLALQRAAARNIGKLKELAQKLPDKQLNKAQRRSVKALEGFGIPRRIGQLLATTPIKSDFKAQGRFKNNYRNYAKNRSKGKNNKVLHFSGGHGKQAASSQQKNFDFSKFLKKKKAKRNTSSNKILRFAQKATEQAQISTRKDDNIFKIITKRYQISSKRRLE